MPTENDLIERQYNSGAVKFPEREDRTGARITDDNTIEGYAAVFNKDSEDLGGYIERIEPGAFDEVLNDECYCLFNHNHSQVLGLNGVNLKLSVDSVGLKYVVDLPNTALAQDLRRLVKAKIIKKSSFAFSIKSEKYLKGRGDVPNVRIIIKVGRLYDVAPVTAPAYRSTSVW